MAKHDKRGPRERAYDEHIAPLMTQVIAHCKAHGIPIAATFQLDPQNGDPSDPLMCTTTILGDHAHPRMRKAAEYMHPGRTFFAAITVFGKPNT